MWFEAAVVSLACYVALRVYAGYSSRRWISLLHSFTRRFQGKTLGDAPQLALLVVSPASGNGRAMQLAPLALHSLSQRYTVETYVTTSSADLQALHSNIDLGRFQLIALCMGDSSIRLLLDGVLRHTGGTWPHAPLVHLPGGSTNVLAAELYDWASTEEILRRLDPSTVRRGNLMRFQCDASSTRFALHVGFSGMAVDMFGAMEEARHSSYAAFGKLAVIPMLLGAIWRNRRDLRGFSVMISDVEGNKMDLGFGLSMFDDTGEALLITQKPTGVIMMLKGMAAIMNGEIARGNVPRHMTVERGDSFSVQFDKSTKLGFDGTAELFGEGKRVRIEVIKKAIPWVGLKAK